MRHRYARSTSVVLGCALTALVATACDDFLSGPGVDQDPNNVTNLENPGPIYVGLQNAASNIFEGQLARISGMYTQQIAGVSRQFLGYDIYQSSSADLDPYWQAIFIGGGLLDARKVQNLATARGDSTTAGIAKVWEALIVGTAADFWGSIPYRQAAQREQFPKPAFDPQLQVYEDLQKKLDTAITFLTKTGATNLGPNGGGRTDELIYAGRNAANLRRKYTEVAYTLKARYYLHTAEVTPGNYALARAAALNGISADSNDFMLNHADAASNNNVHYQFYFNRGDVLPGAAYINLLKKRIAAGVENVERLQFHFYNVCYSEPGDDPEADDPNYYYGYRPAANTNLPGGEGAPDSPAIQCDGESAEGAHSDFYWIGNDPTFRTPLITYVENQLILAEATYRGTGTGTNVAGAQPYLDAARANPKYGPQEFSPLPGTLPATLQNIMEEKYLALFLNPEVWSDFKRTCFPYLAPAPTQVDGEEPGLEIAGRVPYGLSEINTNGANLPSGPTSRSRNANDPNACPRYTYAPGPTQAY